MITVHILILYICVTIVQLNALKIASFNIQILGPTKMSKFCVRYALVEILTRYDLTLIQEIRDSKQKSFKRLVTLLNNKSKVQYSFAVSTRMGRTKLKEQYGIIYNPQKVRIVKQYEYPDRQDKFERSPMALLFSTVGKNPDDVFSEINQLYKVAKLVPRKLGDYPMFIVGDMNADCSYLSQKRLRTISFMKDTYYRWLIPNTADTTVSKTDCAYDRIIASGPNTEKIVKQNSVKVYNFTNDMKLDLQFAKQISDHYPVEMQLKFKGKQ